MYTLVVENIEYSLPDIITVGKWMQIVSLNDNFEDYKRNLVAVTLEIPEDHSKIIPDETIELVVSFILVMLNNTYTEKSSLKMIDFEELTFEQWIDLDVYLTEGLPKYLKEIVNILFSLEDSTDVNFMEVISGITTYTNYRKFIYTSYKNLFKGDSNEDDAPKEKVHPAKIWQSVLAVAADNDLTKFQQVLNMPLKMVLNFMAHKKEKALNEQRELQKNRQ